MADEPRCSDDAKRECPNRDELRYSCSDDDFEKLSIPCSEPVSDDEAFTDTENTGHKCDTKPTLIISQNVPFSFEVRKPPSTTSASVPSVHTEVHQQALGSDRSKTSLLSNQLITLASKANKLMAADVQSEVEKQLRLERGEFERQRVEYRQQISLLEKRCAQLTAAAEENASLKEIVTQLSRDNDHLSQKCTELEHQAIMLKQQAATANREMKEFEDELHALRSSFSATRVTPQQPSRPTFSPVNNSPEVKTNAERDADTRSCTIWECHRCTFHNWLSVNVCTMCDAKQQSKLMLE